MTDTFPNTYRIEFGRGLETKEERFFVGKPGQRIWREGPGFKTLDAARAHIDHLEDLKTLEAQNKIGWDGLRHKLVKRDVSVEDAVKFGLITQNDADRDLFDPKVDLSADEKAAPTRLEALDQRLRSIESRLDPKIIADAVFKRMRDQFAHRSHDIDYDKA